MSAPSTARTQSRRTPVTRGCRRCSTGPLVPRAGENSEKCRSAAAPFMKDLAGDAALDLDDLARRADHEREHGALLDAAGANRGPAGGLRKVVHRTRVGGGDAEDPDGAAVGENAPDRALEREPGRCRSGPSCPARGR